MKKIITIIFCLLVSTTMMGQDCLTFMGVPMQGTIDDFCAEVRAKGFVDEDVENNGEMSVRMKGNFYGEERVIDIYCTPITHKPYRVDIELDVPSTIYGKPVTRTKTDIVGPVPTEMYVQEKVINEWGHQETVLVKRRVFYPRREITKKVTERPVIRSREEIFIQKYNSLIQSLKTTYPSTEPRQFHKKPMIELSKSEREDVSIFGRDFAFHERSVWSIQPRKNGYYLGDIFLREKDENRCILIYIDYNTQDLFMEELDKVNEQKEKKRRKKIKNKVEDKMPNFEIVDII